MATVVYNIRAGTRIRTRLLVLRVADDVSVVILSPKRRIDDRIRAGEGRRAAEYTPPQQNTHKKGGNDVNADNPVVGGRRAAG